MAKKSKEPTIVLERVYNVPLRKEFQKVPRWRRSKKATKALREFLSKHMKSDQIKLSKELNEKVWSNGIRNPPHHVKVTAKKNEEGVVNAELFGFTKKEKVTKKGKKTKSQKKETTKPAEKPKATPAPKAEKKQEPNTE